MQDALDPWPPHIHPSLVVGAYTTGLRFADDMNEMGGSVNGGEL